MPRLFACLALALAAPVLAVAEPLARPVASYRMRARLDDEKKLIEGSEVLTWTNTSAHPASALRFHLYWNAFRNNRSTFWNESRGLHHTRKMPAGGWGEIGVSHLTDASGRDLSGELRYLAPDDGNPDDRTVAEVPLAKAVPPGGSIEISLDFVGRIPRIFARTGYKGDFYFIAQWFPKIGVLQDAGWNCHQYHEHSEFFADFGDYDVVLDLPARFKGKVGATGRLVAETDAAGGRVIEHFRQESVHDFAWAADPNFEVYSDKFSAADLPPVAITLLCEPEHRALIARYFESIRRAIAAFGRRYGPYPYGVLTMIDPPWGGLGAGGMEYPTFISLGGHLFHPRSILSPEQVTIHEFGHQYFYGLLASNEFEEAWLDEGFTNYATTKLEAEAYGDQHPSVPVFGVPIVFQSVAIHPPDDTELGYFDSASRDPLTASFRFRDAKTYGMVYSKTARVLATFERLIGTKTMDVVMKTYATEYRFRHPTTADFLSVVARVTGRDWGPFFQTALFESGTIDYAVSLATSERSRADQGFVEVNGREVIAEAGSHPAGFDSEVMVERRGDLSLPVDVVLKFANGRTWRTTWDGAGRWLRLTCRRGPRLAEADVDPENKILLDANTSNNGLRVDSDAAAANLWTARAYFWVENTLEFFQEIW